MRHSIVGGLIGIDESFYWWADWYCTYPAVFGGGASTSVLMRHSIVGGLIGISTYQGSCIKQCKSVV